MKERDIENISAVINYIEAHLDSRLDGPPNFSFSRRRRYWTLH